MTANVVVCGHIHVQYDRRAADVRLVNAGSVGMPYEGTPDARWLLLDGAASSSSRPRTTPRLRTSCSRRWRRFEWFARPLRGEVTAEEATAAFESRRSGA